MGFFTNFLSSSESTLKDKTIKDPRVLFTEVLKSTSGTSVVRDLPFELFYQVIAFKGVKEGIGCSTIVANTALALANLGLNVCVIDTSILSPCQDNLLKTSYKTVDKRKRVDWMDMHRTSKNVLNTSKLNSKIGVLSFQDRTIVDLLSSNDNSDLVDLALNQLHSKFDIILIDICHEASSIATACLQQSHQLIQIWNNTPHILSNIEQFITNNTICSCPLDKMRYVVTSMTVDDIPTNWDAILKQYKFKHLAHVGLSSDIARTMVTGNQLFNFASTSEDIQEFNDCITDIVCHLLNITADEKHRGSITVGDVIDGRVDGTLSKNLKEKEENGDYPVIYDTIEDAVASLDDSRESKEVSESKRPKSGAIEFGMEQYHAYFDDYANSDSMDTGTSNSEIESEIESDFDPNSSLVIRGKSKGKDKGKEEKSGFFGSKNKNRK